MIFHWYSGDIKTMEKIINAGYYFSINESMTSTKKGKVIIDFIPKDRLLTETDAPFNKKDNIPNVIKYISITKGCSEEFVNKQIENNFKQLISRLK